MVHVNESFLIGLPFTFPCCCFSCFGVFGVISLALWIWALVEAATKESSEGNEKLTWILVLCLTFLCGVGFIGALIYLLVRRPERKRTLGR